MAVILFVCMANQFRSPLAAALFQQRLSEANLADGWTVISAGTWVDQPGSPAHPAAVAEARKLGLDLSGHQSIEITAEAVAAADLVVTMTRGQKEALQFEFSPYRLRIAMLSELADGTETDIPDPAEKNFADCAVDTLLLRSEINHAFNNILTRVRQGAAPYYQPEELYPRKLTTKGI